MDVDSLSGEIGKCLQWLRKSLLLTQYQLASFTELDYRHYQNIESGRVEVKVETLKRICSSFGIGLSTFFYLLDRKPWLTDLSARARGTGDIYLYRMIMEQAKFRLLPNVRDIISEWGRAIAEGNRDGLKDCSKPCVEMDADFRVVWKNPAASEILDHADKDVFSIVSESYLEPLKFALKEFWDSKSHSFYYEAPLSTNPQDLTRKNYALVALRPMISRPDQTLFFAMMEIDDLPLETSSSESRLTLQNANRIFM